MTTPRVSVILPCRNSAATIAGQLGALARQSWDEPWELVVADNGSTDDTRPIVESYRERIPSLRVVDALERSGVGYTCNVGMRKAEAEALVICNDDDEVGDGWLAAMGTALGQHDLVAGRLEHDKLNDGWAVALRGRPQTDELPRWSFGTHLPFAFGCTIGVRRQLHEAIGGFDEDVRPAGEDIDYCWRAQYAGATIYLERRAVTHYRARSELRGIYRQASNYGFADVILYKKHRRLGLPEVHNPLRRGLRAWARTATMLLVATNKRRLAAFLWQFGWRVGMLRAAVERRVLLL